MHGPTTYSSLSTEDDAALRAEFARSPALQAEFGGDADLYVGWHRNEQARGRQGAGQRQPAGGGAREPGVQAGEDQWRAEFAADLNLQAEFMGDVSLFIGWKRNEAALAANKSGGAWSNDIPAAAEDEDS